MFRLRVQGGERSGETFSLVAGQVHVLGRGYDALIRFPEDPTLSRVHAEVALVGNGWVLKNRSLHGTYVGGAKVTGERLLRGGDEITIGSTLLVFEPDPATSSERATFVPMPMVPVAPPEDAGYDSQGVFHMGWSFVSPSMRDRKTSTVFRLPLRAPGLPQQVSKSQLKFFLIVGIGALVGTAILFFTVLRSLITKNPHALEIGALLAIAPTVPYLAAFKLLDRNAQVPMRNYLACFCWGATVACSMSAILSTYVGEAVTGTRFTTLVAAPFFEETLKGLAVLVLFFVLRDEFDNAVEGMLLGAASGLGFALIENTVFYSRFLANGMALHDFLWNGTYRALTCALVGHPVYTAMTGLGFGLAREAQVAKKIRFAIPAVGWLGAIGMHVAWNAATIYVPRLLGRGVGTDVLLALFVGGGCATFFMAVWLYSLARERRILLDHLEDEVEKGFIEADELASFEKLFGRESFVLAGVPRGTYRLRKDLRKAQLELAFRKWHLLQGDEVKSALGNIDRVLLEARARIRDARNAINAKEGRKVGV
jgi:RsiW-degrading membrane proteinase PrsW (M82 family)